MTLTTIQLRAETKPLEHRSALTPTTAQALQAAGFNILIEKSSQRIFDDSEFEMAGLKLVPEGSWVNAPKDYLIIGLKELPEEDFPLIHTHIQFAHCYKNQGGWKQVLGRFAAGDGTLYDLEFLQDEHGRRVAAFGYHAGFAGAALGVLVWAWQLLHPGQMMPGVKPYENEQAMIDDVKSKMGEALPKNGGKYPTSLVIGALGRCGRGAVDLFLKCGVPTEHVAKWDLDETAKGGPFKEIVGSGIFVNCIYLSEKIPNFVDQHALDVSNRQLRVVVDVSCDTTNPNNPIPIYSVNTSFEKPTVAVDGLSGHPVEVVSIDHLPTLLPRESSEAFSTALLPSLELLNRRYETRVWTDAEKLFKEKVLLL